MKKIKHKGIEVDIRSDSYLYITIKDRCYYIENSDEMKGISGWKVDNFNDQVDWTVYDEEQVKFEEGVIV